MLKTTFFTLGVIFVLIVGQFFIPSVRNYFKGSILFLIPLIVFSLLGLALIYITAKKKIKGPLKKFLLLTGTSSAGFFISVLLHNFFFALSVLTQTVPFLCYLFKVLHLIFFLTGVFVCPPGFLIGFLVSLDLLLKKAKK